jgi:signal peptidase II
MTEAKAAKQHKVGKFFLFGIVMIVIIVLADQYAKWLVMETMLRTEAGTPAFFDWFTTRQTLEYFFDQREKYNTVTLTPFLNFVMVWNEGISFGLFNNSDTLEGNKTMSLVFIGLSLMISLMMIVWLALVRGRLLAWALSLIVGGAIGNVIDRVRFGAVADFIDFHMNGMHWPAFNLADTCIAVGALLLVIDTMTSKEKNPFLG